MSKPSSTVRSLPYPALEDGNFSFPNGSYDVSTQLLGNSGTKVRLKHEISNAPFIDKLVNDGDAKCACLVSVPKTGYRKLYITDSRSQEIEWNLDIAGEPPMLRPVVLYIGNEKAYTLNRRDGVAEVWQKQKISLYKGARLASGRYLRPSISIQSLLTVKQKEEMKAGSFTVVPNTNEGFYFTMYAASDIFNFVQNPQGNIELRGSILTHAVSQCFSILERDYGVEIGDESEDQWSQHKNLVALAEWLDAQDMPKWFDDDFDPVCTATELYQIRIPEVNEDE